jgi:hypothetical protein
MKNTVVENGLLFESNTPGQNKPVSNTINEKAALMAAREMKIISATEIISKINFHSRNSLTRGPQQRLKY